jgi:hypothetical protein
MYDHANLQCQLKILLSVLIDPTIQTEIVHRARDWIAQRLPEIATSDLFMNHGVETPVLTWLAPGVYDVQALESGFLQAWTFERMDQASSNGPAVYLDRLPIHAEALNAGLLQWIDGASSARTPAVRQCLLDYASRHGIPMTSTFDHIMGAPLLTEGLRTTLQAVRVHMAGALLACQVRLDRYAIEAAAMARLRRAMEMVKMESAASSLIERMLSMAGERQFCFMRHRAGGDQMAQVRQKPGTVLFALDGFNRISLYGLSAADVLHRVDALLMDPCRVIILQKAVENVTYYNRNEGCQVALAISNMYAARVIDGQAVFLAGAPVVDAGIAHQELVDCGGRRLLDWPKTFQARI